MQKIGKGAIVNISSVHSLPPSTASRPYCASKGGITALTRNMAIDYGPTIRVNSIAPGWVLTPLIQSIFDSYDDPADQQRQVEKRQVMKRIGMPGGYRLRCRFPGQRRSFFHYRHPALRGRRSDCPTRDLVRLKGSGLWKMAGCVLISPKDDLSRFSAKGPAFVTFGETMVRDTPCDMQRLESTRQVYLSLAGSEFTLCMALARFGIPYRIHHPRPRQSIRLAGARYRPQPGDQYRPYSSGRPRLSRSDGFSTSLGARHARAWGITSACTRPPANWGLGWWIGKTVLRDCQLFHTSGISFGLSTHSKYERNYLLEAFLEAVDHKPADCLVGMDFNYRATLWSPDQCRTT